MDVSYDWDDYTNPRSRPESNPLDDETKIPDFDWDIPTSSGSGYTIGEGTTGEKGDTWQLPSWDIPFGSGVEFGGVYIESE